jgi:hypothetical protein
MHKPSTIAWQVRGGEAQGSCQLESPKRSPRHLSANRELSPVPMCACQPSAAAPRPRPLPVRAGFTAPPRVKAAQVVVAGMSGRACPGLDAGWYTVVARTGGRFLYVAYPTPQLKDSTHPNLTLLVSRWLMRNLTLDRMDVQNRWFHPHSSRSIRSIGR